MAFASVAGVHGNSWVEFRRSNSTVKFGNAVPPSPVLSPEICESTLPDAAKGEGRGGGAVNVRAGASGA